METFGRKFPNRLFLYRKLAKLTQQEVAEALGVSQSRVSGWEQGDMYPTLINLLKLSILYRTLCTELYYELYQHYQQEFKDGFSK